MKRDLLPPKCHQTMVKVPRSCKIQSLSLMSLWAYYWEMWAGCFWTSTNCISSMNWNVALCRVSKPLWKWAKRVCSTSWKILRFARALWLSRLRTRFSWTIHARWQFTRLQVLTYWLKWWTRTAKWASCSKWTNWINILANASRSFASLTFWLNAPSMPFLIHTSVKQSQRPLSWLKWAVFCSKGWSSRRASAKSKRRCIERTRVGRHYCPRVQSFGRYRQQKTCFTEIIYWLQPITQITFQRQVLTTKYNSWKTPKNESDQTTTTPKNNPPIILALIRQIITKSKESQKRKSIKNSSNKMQWKIRTSNLA